MRDIEKVEMTEFSDQLILVVREVYLGRFQDLLSG